MRKYILTFLLLLLCVVTVNAQQKVIITLSDGTTIEKEVWEVASISFSPSSPIDVPQTAEAVDLGLSVKWANFNFGASSADLPGYYIGWGDVTGLNYSTNNDYFPVSKPTSGIVAGKYDIVQTMWGGDWRLPSEDEIKELIDKCTWTYDAAKKGYTISSKTNSNSIFLPLAGKREAKDTLNLGTNGYYWSGSLSSTDNSKAVALVVDDASNSTSDVLRYVGCTIRPVYGKYMYGSSVLSCEATDATSTGIKVNVTFNGDYAKATEFGVCYSTTESGLDPDNGSCVKSTSVGSDGTQSFTISGLKSNTTYYYVAYVTYNGNRNMGTTKTFTTLRKFPVAKYVDLGLSVKWATWNIGASSEDEYGSYIGWGDPTGENMSFSNSDYPNDKSDIGGTDEDVAYVEWGKNWRMPTEAELTELGALDKEIVTENGVSGYKITGKNGNTIFIPRCGYMNASGYSDKNTKAYYWTSENISLDYARSCSMGKVSASFSSDEKCLHMPIRPVYDDGAGDDSGVTAIDTTAAGKAAISVDMGLSVRWATYNLGTTSSSAAGSYFAWGETEAKTEFKLDNYANYDKTTSTYTDIGTDIKNTEYDAARKLWGGTWRMPTEAEYQELVDNCTWTWSADKGGYTVTSKNGNTIFMPAAGLYSSDEISLVGSQGQYWTSNYDDSSLHIDDHWAKRLVFTHSFYFVGGTYKYYGLPIRPVRP